MHRAIILTLQMGAKRMKNSIRNISMAMLFMRPSIITMKYLTNKVSMKNRSSANLRSNFNKSMSTSRPSFSCHYNQNYCTTRQISCRSAMGVRLFSWLQQLQTSKYLTVVKTNGRPLQSLTIVTNILVLNFTWILIWYRQIERLKTPWTG